MHKLTLYNIDHLGTDNYCLECSVLLIYFNLDMSAEKNTAASSNLGIVLHIGLFINIKSVLFILDCASIFTVVFDCLNLEGMHKPLMEENQMEASWIF